MCQTWLSQQCAPGPHWLACGMQRAKCACPSKLKLKVLDQKCTVICLPLLISNTTSTASVSATCPKRVM